MTEPPDIAHERDESRAVDRPDAGDGLEELALFAEMLVPVPFDEPVVFLDGLVQHAQQLELRREQLHEILWKRVQQNGEVLLERVGVALPDAHAVGLRHSAHGVDRLGPLFHDGLPHLHELDEVLVDSVAKDDGMEVPLVAVKEVGDLLRVAHVVLVGVAEDGPELVGVADVDVASTLPGEKADPAAVGSCLHADRRLPVLKEERLEVFRLVRDPSAKDDVRVLVESDDGVLFVAQIDSNCGTMLHGLFSCLFS